MFFATPQSKDPFPANYSHVLSSRGICFCLPTIHYPLSTDLGRASAQSKDLILFLTDNRHPPTDNRLHPLCGSVEHRGPHKAPILRFVGWEQELKGRRPRWSLPHCGITPQRDVTVPQLDHQ